MSGGTITTGQMPVLTMCACGCGETIRVLVPVTFGPKKITR